MLFPAVAGGTDIAPKVLQPKIVLGTGTIQLAEDEPGVRDFVRRTLSKCGFSPKAITDSPLKPITTLL
jgi:hypothetical protein